MNVHTSMHDSQRASCEVQRLNFIVDMILDTKECNAGKVMTGASLKMTEQLRIFLKWKSESQMSVSVTESMFQFRPDFTHRSVTAHCGTLQFSCGCHWERGHSAQSAVHLYSACTEPVLASQPIELMSGLARIIHQTIRIPDSVNLNGADAQHHKNKFNWTSQSFFHCV